MGIDLGARHDSLDTVLTLMEQHGMPSGRLSKVRDQEFPIERLVLVDKPQFFLASQHLGAQALIPPTVRRYLAVRETFDGFTPEDLMQDTRMRLCEFMVGFDIDRDPYLDLDNFLGGDLDDDDDF